MCIILLILVLEMGKRFLVLLGIRLPFPLIFLVFVILSAKGGGGVELAEVISISALPIYQILSIFALDHGVMRPGQTFCASSLAFPGFPILDSVALLTTSDRLTFSPFKFKDINSS